MAKKSRNTGEGEKYSDAEAERVAQAIEAAYVDSLTPTPTKLDVRAKIEWAGHVMDSNDGVRRTKLDLPGGAVMDRVRKAAAAAAKRREKAKAARPAKSRTAKGWHAQIRELVEAGPRGSKAADRAGLDVTPRTLKRWLSDAEYPVRPGDRAKIEAAYDNLRNANVHEARDAAGRADKAAADALTDALRDKYGVNIRMRDITDFRFE